MSEVLDAAHLAIGVLFAALGFVYRTVMARIDKLEETSRRDDDGMHARIERERATLEKEMEMRRQDVINLHSKVEQNDRRCQVHGERISKLEGMNRAP